MTQEERTNELAHYRKRMKFTQPEVARLLGWKNIKGLGQLESGRAVPTLMTAFKLSVIYRVPTEFLYSSLYERLRKQVRAKELALAAAGQQTLPLAYVNAQNS